MVSSWSELLDSPEVEQRLLDHPEESYTVPTFEGKQVEMSGGALLVNLLLAAPLHRRGIAPLGHTLFRDGEVFTDSTRIDIENGVIFHPSIRELDSDAKQGILRELYYDTNKLSDAIALHMAPNFQSMDMLKIASTLQDPKIKEILKFDPRSYLKHSLKALEVATEQHNKNIVKALKEIKENNCFRPYLLTGCLNEGQFFQSVCLGGTRTDVDDTAVTLPIMGNYIDGLRGDLEYIIESFSARKSDDYNKEHMGNASYTKRKINLMASAIRNIYPGACDSEATLAYIIPPEHKSDYLGRNVKTEDGKVVTLNPWNIDNYVGKMIQLYSPITCSHTDGCCERCGGMLLELFPPETNIGQAATEQVMNPLQQSILSAKHLMKTLIQLFHFPAPLDTIFSIDDGDIYLNDIDIEGLSSDDIRIGVPTEGVQNISELNEFHGETIPGSYFSAIASIAIAHNETNEIFVLPTDVINDAKIVPHFTGEFLAFLKRHKENITYNGDIIWFSVKGFDRDAPIMGINYVSEAAYIFIQKIEQFFAREAKDGGIAKYNNAAAAVYDLSMLLRNRIKCNSLHIELLVKSALICNPDDMAIPKIIDSENVLFGRMPHINTYRCISNEAAYERWQDYVNDPKAYVTVTKSGLFDPFIGSEDYQHPKEFARRKNMATY